MNAWIEAKAIIGGRSRYCGSGNHTVAMATVFDKVLSVEINPQLVKAAELTGHTARVLHMAASPDGQTIVSAAADETLRFWKILSGGENSKKEKALARDSLMNNTHLTSIR